MLCILFFALYMTSTIETGIILFGSGHNVNSECRNNIMNRQISGQSVATLAWLELYDICELAPPFTSPKHLRLLTVFEVTAGTPCFHSL